MRKLFCFLTCVLTVFILGCPPKDDDPSPDPSAVQAESRPVKKRLCSVVVIGNIGEEELMLRRFSGIAPGTLLVQDMESDTEMTLKIDELSDPEEIEKVETFLEQEREWAKKAKEEGLLGKPDSKNPTFSPDDDWQYVPGRGKPGYPAPKTPTSSSRSMSGRMLAQGTKPAPAKIGLEAISENEFHNEDVSADILAGVLPKNFESGIPGESEWEDSSEVAESFTNNIFFPSVEQESGFESPFPIIPDEDDEPAVDGETPPAPKASSKPETASKKPEKKESETGKPSASESTKTQRAKRMTEEEIRELTLKHLEAFLALNKNLSDSLLKEIAAANFQNYSVWFGESFQGEFYAVRYFEYVGDNFDHDYFQLTRSPVYRKWIDEQKKYVRPMSSMSATSDVWLDTTELFHSGTRFPAGSVKLSWTGGESSAEKAEEKEAKE